jgi:hypothetical protein
MAGTSLLTKSVHCSPQRSEKKMVSYEIDRLNKKNITRSEKSRKITIWSGRYAKEAEGTERKAQPAEPGNASGSVILRDNTKSKCKLYKLSIFQ